MCHSPRIELPGPLLSSVGRECWECIARDTKLLQGPWQRGMFGQFCQEMSEPFTLIGLAAARTDFRRKGQFAIPTGNLLAIESYDVWQHRGDGLTENGAIVLD